jgi:predicted nucleic acid-binding protein
LVHEPDVDFLNGFSGQFSTKNSPQTSNKKNERYSDAFIFLQANDCPIKSYSEPYVSVQMRPLVRIERFLQAFEVLPLDTWLAQTAGALRRDYAQPFADMIIAATAHEYNLRLVTRNSKHFEALHEKAGLQVIKPY